MGTFTSSLPDDLLKLLSEKAKKMAVPKNRLIEISLRLYLEHLEKTEFTQSYSNAAEDEDILLIAEEGMEDYLNQLDQ